VRLAAFLARHQHFAKRRGGEDARRASRRDASAPSLYEP